MLTDSQQNPTSIKDTFKEFWGLNNTETSNWDECTVPQIKIR